MLGDGWHLAAGEEPIVDRSTEPTERAPEGIRALLDACTAPVDLDHIADAALGALSPLGAPGVVLVRVDPAGGIHGVALAGESRRIAPALGTLVLTKRYPLIAAVLEERPIWLPSRSAVQARFPEFAATRPPVEAIADLPLMCGDDVVGGIGIPFAVARSFSDVDRTYLLTVAELVAHAVAALAAAPATTAHPDAALLDRLHDAVMVIDHTADQVTYANQAATELTGRSWGELVGRSAAELLAAVVAPDDPFRLAALEQLGWGVHHVDVVRPDGTHRQAEVHVGERDHRGHRAFVAIDLTGRTARAEADVPASTEDRIDREVHDRAVQAVFATSMGLAALAQAVRPALRPQVDALLDDLDDVVAQLRAAGAQPDPER